VRRAELFRLDGLNALVTGANTGIGRAIAVGLSQYGAQVTCLARRDCDETLALIKNHSDFGRAVCADVSDQSACRSIISDGPVFDILVNNAGVIKRSPSESATEEDWDRVIDTNLKSTFFLSQVFGRNLLDAGKPGKIINIASVLAFQGGIGVASYAASKHGMVGLTRSMSNDWAAHGINVNAISPGYIQTNNTAALQADVERSSAILQRIPAGRWGRPDDLIGASVFLASPASNYVHGSVLTVDGGWLAR